VPGMYDAIIVGAGPAGLSAALILGRCCRRVLVCDGGQGRNAASSALHGFLSRDGLPPAELRRIAREQLRPYETVELREALVTDAQRTDGAFAVELSTGERVQAGKLLLATGVLDELPPIPGLAERWGRTVFPCPYCDAYEFRDRSLGVLGRAPAAVAQARALTTWSHRVTLFCHGSTDLGADDRKALQGHGIAVVDPPVRALEGAGTTLEGVRLADGQLVACAALFVSQGQQQRSPLAGRLGCRPAEGCAIETQEHESTHIPGLYVAGDASDNLQLAIVAAAEGAEAGFAINRPGVPRPVCRAGVERSRRPGSARFGDGRLCPRAARVSAPAWG
jgi:thioredoxin reductase